MLLISIVIGYFIGIIFKDKASVLSPFGDLFINLLLVIIVPLIFVTLTTSIAKMKHPKRIKNIFKNIIIVFIITSLISCFIAILTTKVFTLVDGSIQITNTTSEIESINLLDRTIQTISVNDFQKILSRDNMVALIVFSVLIGISLNLTKDKSKELIKILDSLNEVLRKYINIIMYYAPFGIGCYFASLVGTFGNEIALGYGKTFILYLIISLFFYFIIYGLYAYIAGGKECVKTYFKNIIPSTLTALATCSSAATIPVNQECTKKMGVDNDIADTTIALGTNFHKDGSIIGSVFKIMFLVNLFNSNISTSKIVLIALLATLLITAVPIGGGTISETLIITSLGFNISTLGMLTIIATIIDPPATVLNVVGDSASSLLVQKLTNKKEIS